MSCKKKMSRTNVQWNEFIQDLEGDFDAIDLFHLIDDWNIEHKKLLADKKKLIDKLIEEHNEYIQEQYSEYNAVHKEEYCSVCQLIKSINDKEIENQIVNCENLECFKEITRKQYHKTSGFCEDCYTKGFRFDDKEETNA